MFAHTIHLKLDLTLAQSLKLPFDFKALDTGNQIETSILDLKNQNDYAVNLKDIANPFNIWQSHAKYSSRVSILYKFHKTEDNLFCEKH